MRRGGATQVDGSSRVLPGSHTCCASREKVPRKATNRAVDAYSAAWRLTVLLVTPKPPCSWGRWRTMSTQARSCWVQDVSTLGALSALGALLEQRIRDLAVDVLLLEAILVADGNLAIEVLEPRRLAEAQELIVDEAVVHAVACRRRLAFNSLLQPSSCEKRLVAGVVAASGANSRLGGVFLPPSLPVSVSLHAVCARAFTPLRSLPACSPAPDDTCTTSIWHARTHARRRTCTRTRPRTGHRRRQTHNLRTTHTH